MTSDKRIITTIAFKRGNTIELTNKLKGDQVLLPGEPAFESETGQLKIGDGIRSYDELPYVGKGGADFKFSSEALGDAIVYNPFAQLVFDPETGAPSYIGKWINKPLGEVMDPNVFEFFPASEAEQKEGNIGNVTLKDFNDAADGSVPVRHVWTDAEGAQHAEIEWKTPLMGTAASVAHVSLDPEDPSELTDFAAIWQVAPALGKTVSGIAFHPETGELYSIKADGESDPVRINYRATKFGGGGLDVEVPATAPTTLRFFKGE